jgi:hypothetical protein
VTDIRWLLCVGTACLVCDSVRVAISRLSFRRLKRENAAILGFFGSPEPGDGQRPPTLHNEDRASADITSVP